jgi:SAM-dependent methyltransferase
VRGDGVEAFLDRYAAHVAESHADWGYSDRAVRAYARRWFATPIEDLSAEAIAAHDLAREVPEELWAVITDGLAESAAGGSVLDVGIGTGAVGGRLARAGLDVVGVDRNRSMLAAVDGAAGASLVVGDALALPVATGSVDLVVLACVLHLLDDWRQALVEAVRVLRPGGVVAANVGQFGLAARAGVSRTFVDALVERIGELPPPTGPASTAEVELALAQLGCSPEAPLVAQGQADRSLDDHIRRLEWNPFGWPPGIPQWALSEAAAVTREHVASLGLDAEARKPADVRMGFVRFRTPTR